MYISEMTFSLKPEPVHFFILMANIYIMNNNNNKKKNIFHVSLMWEEVSGFIIKPSPLNGVLMCIWLQLCWEKISFKCSEGRSKLCCWERCFVAQLRRWKTCHRNGYGLEDKGALSSRLDESGLLLHHSMCPDVYFYSTPPPYCERRTGFFLLSVAVGFFLHKMSVNVCMSILFSTLFLTNHF